MPKVCPELAGLAGPFTRIARAMSAEWGVTIVPSGSKCDTDGKTVRIPFTSDYLPLEMRQLLHGMLDHEVCHVAEERRHRDSARETPVEILRAETDPRIQLLINVVEDVRIEKRYSAKYVGVAQNLAMLNLQAADEWATGREAGWWTKFGAALILLAHGLDATWSEDEFGDYLREVNDEIAQMRNGVGEWAADSRDVAKRIAEKVKHKHEDAKGGGSDSPNDKPGSTDMLERRRKQIEEYVIHDAVTNQRYVPHPKSQALDSVTLAGTNLRVYSEAREEVLSQIHALRQKQRALVSAWSRRHIRPGLDRGDVDENVLAGVRLGETDLFSGLTNKRVLNTAITGLVDFSGSMGGNEYPNNGAFYAMRTAIALAETWSSLGVANEWLGYTVQDFVPTGITPEDIAGHYVCRPPLGHFVIKAFDDTMRESRARFGGIRGHNGSNVDGESVVWAWRRLIVRPERRKILVVICDGMPITWNSCQDEEHLVDEAVLQTHLRDTVRMVTKSGVEVICIGAGTEGPRAFYNADTGAKFVYISNISTLATDVFKVMKQRITDFASS